MRGFDGSGSRNLAETDVSPMSIVDNGRARGRAKRDDSLAACLSMVAFVCNEWMHEQMARRSNAGMKTALEGAVARLLTSCECEDISTRCKGYREGRCEGRHTCYLHLRI